MDSKGYLKSYGWQEGEALRSGGLKKPILVKHKKDKKGLGCAPGHDDSEAWWERLFDGQLRNLDIKSGSDGISFKQNEVVASSISKSDSPLYRSFVRGEVLKGTIETDLPSNNGSTIVKVTVSEVTSKKDKKSKDEKKKKKKKSHKVGKPKSKHKKDKKDKKDKKSKHKRKSSH
ncbi:Tma23 [Kluyveromyces lactis]|nr:Tma23 [Kluyveromyces lactis]